MTLQWVAIYPIQDQLLVKTTATTHYPDLRGVLISGEGFIQRKVLASLITRYLKVISAPLDIKA